MQHCEFLFFLIWAPLTIAVNQSYTPCDPYCVDQASKADIKTMKFRCYRNSTSEYTEVSIYNSTDLLDKLDRTKPVIVFVSGWLKALFKNLIDPPPEETLLQALIALGSCNVCEIIWDEISSSEYTFAARSVPAVAHTAATECFDKLVAAGLRLFCIGFSLGAQICGCIGKFVQLLLQWIIGLDPAGPSFNSPAEHINPSDAAFVMTVQTNRGVFGMSEAVGHASFFPNFGEKQPGCSPMDLEIPGICDHIRAVLYFAEAVTNGLPFLGRRCDTGRAFKDGNCNDNPVAMMGLLTPNDTRGSMYFQTNSVPPFSRGQSGATYQPSTSLFGTLFG